MARVLPTGRLPFYLGGGEVHGESPEVRARREAREALARAAAMGRITPLPEDAPEDVQVETGLDVPAPPTPPPTAPASTSQRASVSAKTSTRGGSAPSASLPPARARLLDVVAAESPRVAEHMRKALGLEEPQQEAARRALAVNLGRAGAMVNEAITGAKYDRGAYDALGEEAQRPVTDTLAREALGRQEWQDYGGERERVARLQGAEDERANAATRQATELARDARSQEQRVEDATRADARFNLERQDAAAARSQQQSQFNARMAQEERLAKERLAAPPRGSGPGGVDPDKLAELAKRSQPAAEMLSDIQTVNQFLGRRGDLPGVGPVAAALPDLFISPDGTRLRQAAIRLYRNKVRAESGLAVTEQEAKTALEARGMGAGRSEDAFRQGMASLIREAQQTLANVESGFGPEVVQRRQQLGGTTSRDIPAPAGAGVRMVAPNGQQYEVDASEVPEAQRNGWRRL